jgi:triosephosphate isomerase (TIM)
MNTDLVSATDLAHLVAKDLSETGEVAVAVCPPFISLHAVRDVLRGSPIQLGAQNLHFEEEGAYTGEISAAMLRSAGCRYVIAGHSERRQYFGETDEIVNKKTRQAMKHGLVPILCIGETLEQRESGREQQVVEEQTLKGLQGVTFSDPEALVIAYEPVWAIGTGRTATSEQAQEMHAFIRSLLQRQFDEAVANDIPILYGGSMKPSNAAELLAQPDVDGGLIGGASLKADDFLAIVDAAQAVQMA